MEDLTNPKSAKPLNNKMNPRHSNSLLLVWRVAELEAQYLKAAAIEPTHLLLGLCKVVDLDLPAVVSKETSNRDEILEELLREVRRLRGVFRESDLNAKTFRRALRHACAPPRGAAVIPDQLRKSKETQDAFKDAEHFAEMTNSPVYPAHLLYAVLLAEDEQRDQVMSALGIDKRRLKRVTKQEVLFRQDILDDRIAKRRSGLN
jgi:ATP-dependent Clp protease ATP-binding subunit ClpA